MSQNKKNIFVSLVFLQAYSIYCKSKIKQEAKIMYYYNNNFLVDAEDLIYDFLTYRRNKNRCKNGTNLKVKALPFAMQSLIDNVDFENKNNYCACKNIKQNNLNSKLENIIDEVLDDYEYDGSPIFESEIDRETLNQIIQKIIDMAINKIDEFKNIKNETQAQNTGVNSYTILKSLIEAMLINNIFHKRKNMRDNFDKFMPY